MTGKTTFRLFVIVCLVGVFVWAVRREKGIDPGPDAVVAGMRSDEIREFRLRMRALDMTCRKVGHEWQLVRPVSTRGDSAFIDRLLVMVEELPRLETVRSGDMQHRFLTLSDYELEEPRVRIDLVQDDRTWELQVGRLSPLGDVLYVKLAAEDNVIATSTNLFVALPADLSELRDRGLFQRDPGQVERLELEREGRSFVRVVKANDGWYLRQPMEVRADGQRVAGLIDQLYALRAQSFVWDPRPGDTSDEPEGYGTRPDQAAMQVRIWHKGSTTPSEVVIGKAIDEWKGYYASARDLNGIVAITNSVIDAVAQIPSDTLRARRILTMHAEWITAIHVEENDRRLSLRRDRNGSWQIEAPVQWPADGENVQRFLAAITSMQAETFQRGTNLAAYGLAPASAAVELLSGGPTPGQTEDDPRRGQRLLIGTAVTQGVTYVKLDDADTIFGVAADNIDRLWPHLAKSRDRSRVNPLLFRDRSMLTVNPDAVRGLTLRKDGVSRSVQRPADGQWQAGDERDGAVIQEAVIDVLIALARLRALRIEARNETNLARFGLDEPAITLTVALDASEGIQKIIMIGFRARTDGVYAMVQGTDLVFVLEAGVAATLMRDLVGPRAPSIEDEGS